MSLLTMTLAPAMSATSHAAGDAARGARVFGDTYTIDTADGKSQKIWEFNLRLKTDSSKLGPRPGKPVVIGAGMQGDRASLVLAKPAEISEFIQASCP